MYTKKFRASIYVDVFIQTDETISVDGELIMAREEAERLAREVPNSYVGGVADPLNWDALKAI